jgi:hypothetical protein
LWLLFGAGRIYTDGFVWAQVHAHTAFGAGNDRYNLRFAAFALFKSALWTNTNADLPRAGTTFGEVNG